MSWQDVAREFGYTEENLGGRSVPWPESTVIKAMAEEITRLREEHDSLAEDFNFECERRRQLKKDLTNSESKRAKLREALEFYKRVDNAFIKQNLFMKTGQLIQKSRAEKALAADASEDA